MKKIRSCISRLMGFAMLAGSTFMQYDAQAQANYWSLFGDDGCGSHSNSMNNNVAPGAASFSVLIQ